MGCSITGLFPAVDLVPARPEVRACWHPAELLAPAITAAAGPAVATREEDNLSKPDLSYSCCSSKSAAGGQILYISQ